MALLRLSYSSIFGDGVTQNVDENEYIFKRNLVLYFVRKVKVSFIYQLQNFVNRWKETHPNLYHKWIETYIKNVTNYYTPEFNLTKPHFSFNDVDKLPDAHKIHIFEDTFMSLAKILSLYRNYWRKKTYMYRDPQKFHIQAHCLCFSEFFCSFTFMLITFTK